MLRIFLILPNRNESKAKGRNENRRYTIFWSNNIKGTSNDFISKLGYQEKLYSTVEKNDCSVI